MIRVINPFTCNLTQFLFQTTNHRADFMSQNVGIGRIKVVEDRHLFFELV